MGVFSVRTEAALCRLAVPTAPLLALCLAAGCGSPASFKSETSRTTPANPTVSGDATTTGAAPDGTGSGAMPGAAGGDSSSVGASGPSGANPTSASSAGTGASGSAGANTSAAGPAGANPAGAGSSAGASTSPAGPAGAKSGGPASPAGPSSPAGANTASTASPAGANPASPAGANPASPANPAGPAGANPSTLRTVETVQKAGGKIDLLWVIDNSASMTPEQDNVAANFNSFINQLADAHLNFQTAITTTDVCQQTMPADLTQRVCPVDNYGGSAASHLRGSFIGDAGHRVLKSTDSDLVARFNTYVRQGTDGSDFEHGLTAVQLAVQKSLNGQNEALIRPDAFLAVIVLSDEEDDGIGLGMTDAYNHHNFWADGLTRYRYTSDDMVSYLQATKGAGNFSISGIVGTRNADGTMCSSSVAQPKEEGTQYIAAAKKTGGIIRSVCDTNWGDSMTQIGLDVASQIAQVPLPSKPDTTTIKVYVNGIASADWTYNTANDAVKFNTGKVPPEGAAIKITYSEMP